MKKILLSMLLLAAMLVNIFAMVSCGGGNNDEGAPYPTFDVPAEGYDGSAVTIRFYHTMGQNIREVLQQYIVKFNEIYPNIKIEEDQVGSYDDVRETISTEIATGAQPHIAYCYPDHVALYRRAEAVVSLDELINSQVSDGKGGTLGLTQAQIDDFIDGYYNEGKQFGDDRMYTLPLSKSTEVLYYNKTFFEANNIEVPTTWEELKAVCAKIKTIDPNCIPLGYDSESNWFITMCEQYGSGYTSATKVDGSNFLFDNEQNHAFVKEFNDWYKKGYVTTQEIYGTYTSGLFTAQGENVQKSYMSIGSSAGATHQRPTKLADGSYPFEVGIATVPQVNPAQPKVISQGPSLCIFNKTNKQEVLASWLFVKYLTTTVEFQAAFSIKSGYVPVLESVSENASYDTFIKSADGGDFVSALSAKVCLEQADAYYTSPAFVGSSAARDEVGVLLRMGISYEGNDLDAYLKKIFADAVTKCKYMAR